MRVALQLTVLSLALTVPATAAHADRGAPAARRILKKALDRSATRAVHVRQLARADALVKTYPRSAYARYTRGRILSLLGRDAAALAAYDRAIRIAPRFADAHYNAGVVLTRLKRPRKALARFLAAGRADNKLGDAFYNAAQVYYNLKDYANALRYWRRVLRLEPNSFGVTKKILQAQYALGRFGPAEKTRRRLWQLRRTSRNPRIRRMREVVVDQFHMRGYHVYVFQTFAPTGNLRYLYRFKLTKGGRTLAMVNLESSAILRERHIHSIIGISKRSGHKTTRIAYRKPPTYRRLRRDVKRVISRL